MTGILRMCVMLGTSYYFFDFLDFFFDFLCEDDDGETELREESLFFPWLSTDLDLERLLREELVLRRDDFLSDREDFFV